MDRATFCAIWVLTFLVPWDNTVAFGGLGSLARLAGAAAFGMSVVTTLSTGRLRRPRAFELLAAAFVAWSAASLLWTIDINTTLERTTTYVQVALLAWLIAQHARTEHRQHLLLRAYVLGAFVPALDTLNNYLQGASISESSMRFAATGFNANEVAIILVLGMPMAWYLLLLAERRAWALLYASYLPLSLLIVFLTASRGAFVAALAALLLVPWSLSRLSTTAKAGTVALMTVAVVTAIAFTPASSLERIERTASDIAEGDLTGRGALWAAALRLSMDHPLAGVGAGSFMYASQPLGRPLSPHQTFLEVLTGQGIVGLALFVGMLIAAFAGIGRFSPLQRKFWIVLGITLFIGLLPRTFDYRKPLWFVLGVVSAQGAVERRQHDRTRRSDRAVLADSASAA